MTQRPKLNSRVLRKKLTVLCPINRRRLNSTILRRLERPTKSPMLLNNLPMLSYKRLARRRSLREPTKKLMKISKTRYLQSSSPKWASQAGHISVSGPRAAGD